MRLNLSSSLVAFSSNAQANIFVHFIPVDHDEENDNDPVVQAELAKNEVRVRINVSILSIGRFLHSLSCMSYEIRCCNQLALDICTTVSSDRFQLLTALNPSFFINL